MITGYSDHAANERTFLAWVRTGIAVIALGFLIEKFNLFLRTIASAAIGERAAAVGHLGERVSNYEGLLLIFGGVAMLILATTRFVRTARLLEDPAAHPAGSVRTELILCACLVLVVASYSLYLAF